MANGPFILVADDQHFIRSGILRMLEEYIPGAGVDFAEDGNEVKQRLAESTYDLILLDVQMPGNVKYDLMEDILRTYPHSRIIIISVMEPEDQAAFVLRGAFTFLSKKAAESVNVETIRRALNDEPCHSPELARALVDASRNKRRPSPFEELSEHEMKILKLLWQGHRRKAISSMLYVAINTVSSHKSKIFDKLGIESYKELNELVKEWKVWE